MKILRVIARLNVGGPARHVVLLEQGLRAHGHDTLLVHGGVGQGEASMDQIASSSGGRIQKLNDLGRRINLLSDARAFLQLLRITFREAPDVIHSHTAKAGVLARLSAMLYNATRRRVDRALIVHTFHGHVFTGYFNAAASAVVRTIERLLAMFTDCIVTISPAQRHDIVSTFNIAPESRVAIVPLGLDLDPLLAIEPRMPGIRQTLGIPVCGVVFAFIGRFVPVKDIGTLIRAFAEAHRIVTNGWLILAGDGPTRPEMERLAAELSIVDRVRFLGWTDDLVGVYAALDVCVLTSLNEGTPVALIEAMAAAKASVATGVGGVADVVTNRETGLIVPPRQPAACARAMVELGLDASLRRKLGDAARIHARKSFGKARLVNDIEDLYQRRLAAKRATCRGPRTPAARC